MKVAILLVTAAATSLGALPRSEVAAGKASHH